VSAGRPRRRLYRLTPSGSHAQAEVFGKLRRGVWHEQAIQHHTATRGCIPGQPGGFPDNTSRWVDALARSLISNTLPANAPASLSERLGRGVAGGLRERRGPWRACGLELGCCWATTVIAHE